MFVAELLKRVKMKLRLTRGEFDTSSETSFERPGATDVSHRVSPSTKQEKRFVERLDEANTVGMA